MICEIPSDVSGYILSRNLARHTLWGFLLIALWAIIVLPSTLNAQWGHLDDGVILMMAGKAFSSSFAILHDRIFPVYLLHNRLLFLIGGLNPGSWYLVQSVELLAAEFFVYCSLFIVTRKVWVGALGAILFLTASPIAENYYTASKQEPVLALFLSMLVFSMMLWCVKLARNSKLPGPMFVLVSIILTASVIFTKETGLLLIIMSLPPFLFFLKDRGQTLPKRFYIPFLSYALSFASCTIMWIVMKKNYASSRGDGYTKFRPFEHLYWNSIHYLTQSPDVLVMIVLTAVVGAFVLSGRKEGTRAHDPLLPVALVLGWGLILAGIAYMLLLLAWSQGHSYYLLPVSLIFSVAFPLLLMLLLSELKERHLSKIKVVVVISVATVIMSSRFFSLPYIYDMAIIQRSSDITEAAVRHEVYGMNPANGRLFDMDWHNFEEPNIQNTFLFRVLWGREFEWIGGAGLVESYNNERGVFRNMGENGLENVPLDEKDLFLFSNGSSPPGIVIRGVRFIQDAEMKRRITALENRLGAKLREVKRWHAEAPVFQPLLLSEREFKFEKILYALDLSSRLPVVFSWEGVFPDHYTSEKATLRLTTVTDHPMGTIRIVIMQDPAILRKILPLSLELKGKRSVPVTLTMEQREKIVSVSSLLPDGNGEISFIVKNPWMPYAANPLSGDKRVLGPQVEYLPGTLEQWHYDRVPHGDGR